jgi:uncharacterized protein
MILGPRRVGKTTAMYQTIRHLLATPEQSQRCLYLRMDHPLLLDKDLGTIIKPRVDLWAKPETPLYLFIDEITYARKWDLWLKTMYDEQWPVRVVATSSSSAALRDGRVESGVGRWDEHYLSPYLFNEYVKLRKQTVPTVRKRVSLHETVVAHATSGASSQNDELRTRFLLIGGFPELIVHDQGAKVSLETATAEAQKRLRTDAVERVIYKDIPQAVAVQSPATMERLFYTIAGQMTGLLSPQSLCQSVGSMSGPTVERYLTYLERAMLIFTLQGYSATEEAKQRRGRKVFFFDGAIRNAALQRGELPVTNPAEMGQLLENACAAHLYALAQQDGVRLYYWRDRTGEVDFVYDHPSDPIAFEIASSESHRLDGMYRFMNKFPRYRGRMYLVYPGAVAKRPESGADGIGAIDIDNFLLLVGELAETRQSERLGVL